MISVNVDVSGAVKMLSDVQQKHVPFATSLAINALAATAVKEMPEQMEKELDKPTPFTRRGYFVLRSSKTNLIAVVHAKTIQEQYLKYQADGGERAPKRRAIPIPAQLKPNQFGNIPRGKIAKLLARPDVFMGEVKGILGVWQRTKATRKANAGLKLLVYLEPDKVVYKPIFNPAKLVELVVHRDADAEFRKALERSLK